MSRYTAPKSTSLLTDSSWIRKNHDEDEDIDRDPNFGKTVLSHRSSLGSQAEERNTTKPIRTSTSVQALTKRFSGSQDELPSSTVPSRRNSSSYTKSTTPTTTVTGEPKTSTTTTTVTKNGTTETTTSTVRSPVSSSPTQTFTERVKSSSKGPQYSTYSPTRTTKVTETTVTSNKDAEEKLYDTLIPSSIKGDSSPTDSKTTVSTTKTVTVKSSTDTDAEDKLYDTLIPSSIKDDISPTDSKTSVFSTETVTVKSSADGDVFKPNPTSRTSPTAEDELYDTLLPKSITSNLSSPVSSTSSIRKREQVPVESSKGGDSPTLSSPSSTYRTSRYSSYTDDIPSTRTTTYTISTKPSDDYSSEQKTYSYSRPDSSYEYSSVTSPTVYTTSPYRSNSRSDDILGDQIYSKSSTKSVYASPERMVLEKDLCSYCHKPFAGDAKMVLDDMRINCHATCFKCAVCNSNLGHMKAGDSLWIYKSMVHCENCFEVTRDKWRR